MNQNQLEIPIQPVERPILCSPYEEPDAHWVSVPRPTKKLNNRITALASKQSPLAETSW